MGRGRGHGQPPLRAYVPILPKSSIPSGRGVGLSQLKLARQAHSGHQARSSLAVLRPLAFGPAGACHPGRGRSTSAQAESQDRPRSEGNASFQADGSGPADQLPAVPASPISVTAAALWDQPQKRPGRSRKQAPRHVRQGQTRLDPHTAAGKAGHHQPGRQVPSSKRNFQWGLWPTRTASSSVRKPIPTDKCDAALSQGLSQCRYVMGFESNPAALLCDPKRKQHESNRKQTGQNGTRPMTESSTDSCATKTVTNHAFSRWERYSEILGKCQRNP